jgi:hypothetical protein
MPPAFVVAEMCASTLCFALFINTSQCTWVGLEDEVGLRHKQQQSMYLMHCAAAFAIAQGSTTAIA